jgi:hypothetical protein
MSAITGWFFPKMRIGSEAAVAVQSESNVDHAGAQLPPLPALEGEALFQVFVLGTRGAGKTVFLASLFNLLQTQDDTENNFILTCKDTKNLNQLRSTFSQINRVEADWPLGTFSSQEYIFDCEHVKEDGKSISLFKFRYFDFPGGFVTEAKNEAEMNFVLGQVRNAHSVLVLLDGTKVRNFLEKRKPQAKEFTLFDDLNMMVGILQQCVGKPLHFAITKSDILDSKVHTLEAIRDALLQHKGFSKIIRQQRKKHPVHLVPVSAVGNNFVEFDSVTQTMTKRHDGQIEPSFVDLSLTLTLVDYLTGISKSIDSEFPEKSESTVVRNWVWKKLLEHVPILGGAAGPVIDVGGSMLLPVAAIHPVFQVLISLAAGIGLKMMLSASGSKIKDYIEQLKSDVDSSFDKISDRRSAIDAILKNQMLRAMRFRESYPASYFEPNKS